MKIDTGQDSEVDIMGELQKDSDKLIHSFGAEKLNLRLNHEYFKNGLVYSHRDFDKFHKKLIGGAKSAIVSGFNPSGSLHLGHLALLNLNRFMQEKYGTQLFIPISDDESYVTGKIKTQEEGLKNSLTLARSLLAYGFDLKKTKIVVDQLYTNIYNLAIKFSKSINITTIRSIYDYEDSQNVGLHFYPAIQAAHIALPQLFGIKNVLVPISVDEDTHIRLARDIMEKHGFDKASVLHVRFLPGIDKAKMSKSKNNAIFLLDDEKTIRKKIGSAFSGGRENIAEHRRLGGIPEADIAYIYLKYYFMNEKESGNLYDSYQSGKLLSGEVKQILIERVLETVARFKERYGKVTASDIAKCLLVNENFDMEQLIGRLVYEK